jgi:hypothetical protein
VDGAGGYFVDFVLVLGFCFLFCSWTLLISVLVCQLIVSLFFCAGFSESKVAFQLSSAVPSLNL